MRATIWFAGILLIPGCARSRSLAEGDQVAIYSAVIHDFTGRKDIVLDPVVLAPVEERLSDRPLPTANQPSAVMSALKAQNLVIGVCRPIQVQGHQGCQGDPAPVAIALSAIKPAAERAAKVSILWHSVCTRAEPLCIGFAVEYEYTVQRVGAGWTILNKHRTMIT